jgi:serine palmitoyltransferase
MEKTHKSSALNGSAVSNSPQPVLDESFHEIPLLEAIGTYISYSLLIFWGYISDFLRKIGIKNDGDGMDKCSDDFFKLTLEFDGFYTRNIYRRIRDTFNRPVAGVPGALIDILERRSDDYNWTFHNTGKIIKCINLGSYNYLGFAQNEGPCADAAIEALHAYGPSTSSSQRHLGTLDCVRDLEKKMAQFLNKPDALVFGMGFGTNSTNIPALVEKVFIIVLFNDLVLLHIEIIKKYTVAALYQIKLYFAKNYKQIKGCLIISDARNHTSIYFGGRLSGATYKAFKHNDMENLEKILREAVVNGQPRTHRPWKKILIIVEGIYSMEGSVPNLVKIVELKKKYKAYLYIDEAHSIGSMGPTGRGTTEHCGIDTSEVDIMMGTFSKSFSGSGGYMAASKDIINHLRSRSHSTLYAETLPAPVVMQILTSLKILMGEDNTNDGQRRITQFHDNNIYFKKRLLEMNFTLHGCMDSPVVPIMMYQLGVATAFSRMLLKRGIAVVTVGYPGTKIDEALTRVCISASHTREILDSALKEIKEVGTILGVC